MSTLPNFFYSDAILAYSFGPHHPLKPERLRRAIQLLRRFGVETIDPGPGSDADIVRVHSEAYLQAVIEIGREEAVAEAWGLRVEDARFGPKTTGLTDEQKAFRKQFGFGNFDNPPFPDMHDISLDYVCSVVKAAEAVRDGAKRGFGIGGGLHHAQRARASGFCVYNDPAIALHILRERFDRVAYVDIDVHHGDGVENIFASDPHVLTVSIHEDGRTLFPGTGDFEEQGIGDAAGSILNLPLPRGTTGDVWLDLFRRVIPGAVESFGAQAIVLQMGTDPHPEDRLGHFEVGFREWLGAVQTVHELDLPVVAVGGGGYNLATVPRMWTAACLTLGDIEFEDKLPSDLAHDWGVQTFSDPNPVANSVNAEAAAQLLTRIRNEHPLGRSVR